MTRDEAFYAFGKATGDEQIGQCYPEMRRLGALPAPDAPLYEHLAFVGRAAVAIDEPPLCLWPTDFGWCVTLGEAQATAPDLSHAALLAALAALEVRHG